MNVQVFAHVDVNAMVPWTRFVDIGLSFHELHPSRHCTSLDFLASMVSSSSHVVLFLVLSFSFPRRSHMTSLTTKRWIPSVWLVAAKDTLDVSGGSTWPICPHQPHSSVRKWNHADEQHKQERDLRITCRQSDCTWSEEDHMPWQIQ